MFKDVKKKLTVLYTFSLLFLLILFISLLYIFISSEIERNEERELRQFFEKEKHELYEDFYEDEKEHRRLKFNPRNKVFFYVFSESNELLFGEETVKGFVDKIQQIDDEKSGSDPSIVVSDTWGNSHFMLISETVQLGHNKTINVYVGKDITNEKHFIQNITWALVILTVIFSVLFGLLGYYFAGQAMKPITQAFESQRKFVSDASHELRTPISIFYSSIDLLIREEKEHLSAFGQEVLEDAKYESEMMNKLINDLLFLARNDNQNLKIEKESICLSQQIHSLCRRVSRTVPPEIDFSWQVEEGIHIYGDNFRLQQLVYILLDNAFRYTKNGQVKLVLKSQSNKVKLEVEDTGIGIQKDDLPYIFDRFYRGDKSRVRDGAGLGLSIAHTIVTAHCGEMNVRSEPGVGTVLTIIFNSC